MKLILISLIIGVLSIIIQLSDLAQAEGVSSSEFDRASAVYHPWLVSIQRDHTHFCAGSIITESIILSAASCFGEYVMLKRLTVRVSSSQPYSRYLVHDVANVKLHEDYNYAEGLSNLALVKVSLPFEFNEDISPISLSSEMYVVGRGTNASVVSWGHGAKLSDFKFYCKHGVWRKYVCISSKKVCLNDAGSPLVANRALIGVMQGDSSCDQPSKIRITSDVSYDLEWIVQNAAALQPFSYEKGKISTYYHHSWLARILRDQKFLCAGSMVSQNIIVSSASCFAEYMGSELTVRVGSSVVDYGGSVHQVVLVSKHENFSYNYKSGSVNNVALLKVSPPIASSDCAPIQPAAKGYAINPGEDVSVVGWFWSEERESLELREIKFRIANCARKVSEGIICASLPTLKRIFGSPNNSAFLVHNGFLLGIQVQDLKRTSLLHPRAYTDVSYNYDWINKSIVSWSSDPIEIGDHSTIDLQPWLASIQAEEQHVCAGSIISQSIVLTSVSCCNRLEKISGAWYVRAGSTLVDSGGSYHHVVDIRKHEGYSLTAPSVNDIALLKVSEPFQFNSALQAIKLADKRFVVDRYIFASIAGWRWSDNEASAVLKDAKLQILDQCTRKISDGQICVAPVNGKGCLLDTGSPLVTNNIQIGVMSSNLACISPQYSRIYNSISYYRDWIDKKHKEMGFEPIQIGQISTIDLQPWLASIQAEKQHVCAGSIISQSIVLTSVSCCNRLDRMSGGWYVQVGSSTVNSSGSYHHVVGKKEHEGYSSTAHSVNDIALLKVSEPFQFNTNVRPIELASKEYVLDLYTIASINGWRWSDIKESVELKKALGIVDQCADKISDGQICIIPINGKGCLFDIGSPLVADHIQIGVMSQDLSCEPPEYSRIYNSISHHSDWIEENRMNFL